MMPSCSYWRKILEVAFSTYSSGEAVSFQPSLGIALKLVSICIRRAPLSVAPVVVVPGDTIYGVYRRAVAILPSSLEKSCGRYVDGSPPSPGPKTPVA